MRGVREELVAIYYREQKRELSKCAAVGQDICISVFEGLSLEEYVDVRSQCAVPHTNNLVKIVVVCFRLQMKCYRKVF